MDKRHRLTIDEPWDFREPGGGIWARGAGLVEGPGLPNWQERYYLLDLEAPFLVDGERVWQVVCAPRYSDDALEKALTGDCVVGIARVREQRSLAPGEAFAADDVSYFAIGRIAPAGV